MHPYWTPAATPEYFLTPDGMPRIGTFRPATLHISLAVPVATTKENELNITHQETPYRTSGVTRCRFAGCRADDFYVSFGESNRPKCLFTHNPGTSQPSHRRYMRQQSGKCAPQRRVAGPPVELTKAHAPPSLHHQCLSIQPAHSCRQ